MGKPIPKQVKNCATCEHRSRCFLPCGCPVFIKEPVVCILLVNIGTVKCSPAVDELGFVPFDRAGGELLFNLLSERYERRSTLITTNLAFGEWVQVFGDAKLTTALLDRLGHHSHILTTKGSSFRSRNRELGEAANIRPKEKEEKPMDD